MIEVGPFHYEPEEYEREKASNSYLMSLIAVMGGLPLPIINLLATLYFWLANRHSSYFVRWHCIQALLSQVSLLLINTVGFWWTLSIIFRDATITNPYIAYMLTLLLCNLAEFIATIYTAIQTRKGIHVSWWAYGELTHQLVKP